MILRRAGAGLPARILLVRVAIVQAALVLVPVRGTVPVRLTLRVLAVILRLGTAKRSLAGTGVVLGGAVGSQIAERLLLLLIFGWAAARIAVS